MNERTSTNYDLGLPNVEVGELIGGGGFARVYRGRDSLLKRDLAIKILRPVLGQDARTAFENEAGIHGPLSRHENIVTIHHAGITTDGAHPYLVMDLVTGGSLGEHLDLQGSIAWDRAVKWIIPICSAVQHVHESGILHRDIKPDNILLDPPSTPLLSDLGIACLEDDTRPIDAMSFPHVAPEGLRGRRREAPSDVFSLGTTLYQLIGGHAPFGNSAEERVMNLQAIPPRLPTRAAVPLWLEDILHRALEPDPQLRIQTARDLQAELQAGLDGGVASPPLPEAMPAHQPPVGVVASATPAHHQPAAVADTGSRQPSLQPEHHDWYVPSVQRSLSSDERVHRGRPLLGGLLGIATGVILLVLAVAAIEGVRESSATEGNGTTIDQTPASLSSTAAPSSLDSFGNPTSQPPNDDTIPPTTALTTTQPPTTAPPTTTPPTVGSTVVSPTTATSPATPTSTSTTEEGCADGSTTSDGTSAGDEADPCTTTTTTTDDEATTTPTDDTSTAETSDDSNDSTTTVGTDE